MREKSAIAVEAIKTDPRRFARLTLKRAVIFWTALGGNGMSRVVIGEITVASVFGIAGLVALLSRRIWGAGLLLIPFLVFPLPYYITHPDFRFRLLLEPLALVVTAWAMVQVYGYAEARRTR